MGEVLSKYQSVGVASGHNYNSKAYFLELIGRLTTVGSFMINVGMVSCVVLMAMVALVLARERITYITATPAYRLIYSPLRNVLIYATFVAALGGAQIGWNKVVRTGTAAIK